MTNETKEPELLPCPFCGCAARLAGGPMAQEMYSVWCVGQSRHRMDYGFDKEIAIAAWNTRADLSYAQAARIAELEAERDETMREALSLARSLHRTHYSDVTQWEPLDYPAGIISQIDNMVAGIVTRTVVAEAKLADCDPYLKDHETPAQRLESNHKEALSLMKLLEQEKRHSEAWVKASRTAEAKLANFAGYVLQEYLDSTCPFAVDSPFVAVADQARATLAELKGGE